MKYKRLKMIGDLIPKNSVIADIGTDHGILPFYLVDERKAKKVIATDISMTSIDILEEKISQFKNKKIETRWGDGLSPIRIDEVEGVVLTGLGGFLIKELLEKDLEKVRKLDFLILQANVGIEELRKYIHSINFKIEEEIDLFDGKHYYTIIKAVPGNEKYTDLEYRFGKIHLKRKSLAFQRMIRELISWYYQILKEIDKKSVIDSSQREKELQQEIKLLKEILEGDSMITLRDFADYIEEIIPLELKVEGDNCGIQVGDPRDKITKMLISLDHDKESIEYAIENGYDAIFAHHPLLRPAIDTVINEGGTQGVAFQAIKNGISLYTAHTNLDSVRGGVSDVLGKLCGLDQEKTDVLAPSEFSKNEGLGRVGEIEETEIHEYLKMIKENLGQESLIVWGKPEGIVKKVAVCGGSGASFIEDVQDLEVDVYLTGDLRYHQSKAAAETGLLLVDLGHYGSEKIILPRMEELVKDKFSGIETKVFYRTDQYKRNII